MNPSVTDIAQQWAERYRAQFEYVGRVYEALAVETNEILTTTKCTECDLRVTDETFELSAHWIMFDPARDEHVVIIGCEGYWLVDPSAVGIQSEFWSGIPGINV